MSRLDELNAELAYEETKAAYIKAKEKNKGSGKTYEEYLAAKAAYGEARTLWRLRRTPPDGPGDGVASPPPIEGAVT
jgi:hypothetical protein